jgi:hypothetical protein
VVTFFVGWVGTQVIGLLGRWRITVNAQAVAAVSANINQLAMNSIQAGVMASQHEIEALGWDHSTVRDKIVLESMRYAVGKARDMLKETGHDPATPEGAQYIKDVITRAMPAGTLLASQSPITPPVPDEQKPAAANVTVQVHEPAAVDTHI